MDAISFLFGVVVTTSIGLFVYLKDRKRLTNRTWGALCLGVGWWYFGRYMRLTSVSETDALFWCRFLYIGAIFIPPLFLHFSLSLLGIKKRKVVVTAYLLSFIFFISNFTDLFIKNITLKNSLYYPIPGILYPFYVIFFIGCVVLSSFELVKAYMKATGYNRNQIKYVFLASIIGFFSGITTFPLVFNIKIPPIGAPFVSLYTIIVAYAIVKYRLMDIDIIIKKGATYTFLVLFLLIPSLVLVMLGQMFFFGFISYLFSFIVLILFGLATFIFPRLKPGAEKTIEQILFRGKYDYKKTLNDLSKALISILDKETLLAKIINTITEAMGVKKASILLLDEEKGYYVIQSSIQVAKVNEESSRLVRDDPFIIWLREKGEIIVKEELEGDLGRLNIPAMVTIIKRLNDMESEVCIPLITRQKLIGLWNIGKKMNGDMFSHEDIDLLEALGNQAAVAIENAQLYDGLKKSEAQMRRADRLAALGTLTAGLAHEIRNPLVAIKTFIQLLPERFDDIEFRDHFLKITSGEVDRISSLVNELLEFARPSEPHFQEENINEIAEKMIILIMSETKKKNIKVNIKYGEEMPPIMIDKEQIKQVLLNLFLNAIEATSENGIIIFETALINKSDPTDYIQMKIRDTGKGIPKDDIEHIFTPFFTTKHQGSGLGLSISHKIVEDHMGYIEVESAVGNGSTFYVYLPLTPFRNDISDRINLPVVNKTREEYEKDIGCR
ncbi:MAG: GAF domain-containing protein [Desulfobacterales bacterium]|nr:GAF domain-containing protein [Desulfobacterales bacterium]